MTRGSEPPTAVRMIDLADPLKPIGGLAAYGGLRLFVSRDGAPIGSVDIVTAGADAVSEARIRDAVAEQLALPLLQHALRTQLHAGASRGATFGPTVVSVVVPSCDREADLRRCLASLVEQRTRHTVEIVVVDNRPSHATARRVATEFPGVRVVDESRPGLSYARNTGILHASGEIIAATDDDVVAPSAWLETLLEPFVRPEVAIVTGHVLPLELDTDAQRRFEAYGGLGKGFSPAEFDAAWFRGQAVAVPTWKIGATANAAFRASIFRDAAIGLLDEALGAGMPTGCSEDTYVFYRALKAGHTIVYRPQAYVWHRHRPAMEALRSQIYAYSKGHVAYHLTTWRRDGDRRALIRLLYSLPKTYLQRAMARVRRRSDYPISLLLLEIWGNVVGPFALWRARRRVRRFGRSLPLPERSHAVSLESPVAQDPSG